MRSTGKACLAAGAAIAMMQLAASQSVFAEDKFAGIDVAPTKVGVIADLKDMKEFCGTKKIKVALSDGYGENSWRKITRAEFEDEAAKCPNITEVRYTNGQGNPQKQISDIQGLIAQKFDVILVYPDGGEAILKAMTQATQAGAAVVTYDVGEHFPGTRGKDYLDVTTESLTGVGRTLAEWTVKQLNGSGNVIVLGGTPGNPTSAAMAIGWKEVFDKAPGIKVLEGPVDTNWDPAESQRVMASMLAKYPKIDAVMSDYGLGSMGALRAFVAAGRRDPALAGPGRQRTRLLLGRPQGRQSRLQARDRLGAHLARARGAAQGGRRGRRHQRHRAQHHRAAVGRGQRVLRSGAGAQMRSRAAARRHAVDDALQGQDGKALRQVEPPSPARSGGESPARRDRVRGLADAAPLQRIERA